MTGRLMRAAAGLYRRQVEAEDERAVAAQFDVVRRMPSLLRAWAPPADHRDPLEQIWALPARSATG